jgi:argininosuccinate lyase
MTFHAENAQRAADDPNLVAVDIAERLVEGGMPFRQAHEQVGQLVGDAVRQNITLAQAVAQSDQFAPFADLFAPGASLRARTSPGGSGPASQNEQADRLQVAIDLVTSRLI